MTARYGQTIGQMAVGIRVVDHASGGRPTWSRTAYRWVAGTLPFSLPALLPPSRSMQRLHELGPRAQALREEHRGNRQRLNEELMALYRRERLSPVAGCAPVVLTEAARAAMFFVTLRDPLRRGPGDRLAGTIVIDARDRRR